MSIKIEKELDVAAVSSIYGVQLSTSKILASFEYDIDSILLTGDTAKINISLKINEIITGYSSQVYFNYDKDGKDLYEQAFDYLNANITNL
ncbi:MAG: hypothetical protein [Bacteriophage sp.]|nr:MAG: hypothetical protein [Bacteriophage sp.]